MEERQDTEISRQIREAMAEDEHLGRLDVQIQVVDGVAILRGLVDSAMQSALAEEAARVGGARDVVNELEISGEPIAGIERRRHPSP